MNAEDFKLYIEEHFNKFLDVRLSEKREDRTNDKDSTYTKYKPFRFREKRSLGIPFRKFLVEVALNEEYCEVRFILYGLPLLKVLENKLSTLSFITLFNSSLKIGKVLLLQNENRVVYSSSFFFKGIPLDFISPMFRDYFEIIVESSRMFRIYFRILVGMFTFPTLTRDEAQLYNYTKVPEILYPCLENRNLDEVLDVGNVFKIEGEGNFYYKVKENNFFSSVLFQIDKKYKLFFEIKDSQGHLLDGLKFVEYLYQINKQLARRGFQFVKEPIECTVFNEVWNQDYTTIDNYPFKLGFENIGPLLKPKNSAENPKEETNSEEASPLEGVKNPSRQAHLEENDIFSITKLYKNSLGIRENSEDLDSFLVNIFYSDSASKNLVFEDQENEKIIEKNKTGQTIVQTLHRFLKNKYDISQKYPFPDNQSTIDNTQTSDYKIKKFIEPYIIETNLQHSTWESSLKNSTKLSIEDFESSDLTKPELNIGKGGFGEVFKNKYCGKKVAIKFELTTRKSSQSKKNFFREYFLTKAVNHKNVLKILGWIEYQDRLGIVMKLYKHGVLTDYIRDSYDLSTIKKIENKVVREYFINNGVMEDQIKLDVIRKIGNALNMMHSKNLIHFDLKPQNVYLSGGFEPIIADFGLTQEIKNGTVRASGCSVYYCPAEQIISSSKLSAKADVWAFGSIMFYIFTNKNPYYHLRNRKSGQENKAKDKHIYYDKIFNHVERPVFPITLEENQPELCEIIKECFLIDPDTRPTIETILEEMEAL